MCKYYAKWTEGLRTSNPHNWWRSAKLVTGLKMSEPPLSGLYLAPTLKVFPLSFHGDLWHQKTA